MGQGDYMMLAYGTLAVPERPAGADEDRWYGWAEELQNLTSRDGLQLRTQYESAPYVAIPLAVSDGYLERHWHVPISSQDAAWRVGGLAALVEPHMEAVRALWASAQAEVAQMERTLPDGELLIIFDYD